MRQFASLAAATVLLGACALKGDVRRVERQVIDLQQETARADSARAVMLEEILGFQQQLLDSVAGLQQRLTMFQGDARSDMTEVQRQLVQIQELTGQSQQRLSEMRAQLQQRLQQEQAPAGGVTGGEAGGEMTARQLYDLGLEQLRRGSPGTARQAFRKFLQDFPNDSLVPDAELFLGETWEESQPDSAAQAYEDLFRRFPDSPRAPTALYRLGLLAEKRGDTRAAEQYYQRVIAGYPRSDEAQLARTKLPNPQR